jgi:hypothetical protein
MQFLHPQDAILSLHWVQALSPTHQLELLHHSTQYANRSLETISEACQSGSDEILRRLHGANPPDDDSANVAFD